MLKYLYLIFSVCFFFLPIKYIDASLFPYYNKFKHVVEEECLEYRESPKVFIYFKKLSKNEIGRCYTSVFKTFYIIQLDNIYWSFATEFDKTILMMHELSHCVLNQDHVDNSRHYMFWNDSVVDDLDEQLRAVARKTCGRK